MSKKLFENLLEALKRANKKRKLILASKAGFSTVEEYKLYLDGMIKGSETIHPKSKKTVHVVDLLDVSFSMNSGGRIKAANEGIIKGIQDLKGDHEVNYTYSLEVFGNIVRSSGYMLSNPENVNLRYSIEATDGSTALNDGIGETIRKMLNATLSDSTVLLNVYTDGMENSSINYTKTQVKNLIESNDERIVVTFIGVKKDAEKAAKDYGLKESNTLAYDGTGKDLENSLSKTRSARKSFSTRLAAGENVKSGFYKNVKK